jgi:hypothetical protein
LKLSPAHYLAAFRSAPPGRRFEVVRKLHRAVTSPGPVAAVECFDIGEFRSFEEFETKYAALATELGHAGKSPPRGEIDFLHAMVDLDGVRYPGGIGSRDYFFLTALVSILAPRRVIEIGTLTGFSTAIIAAAIHRQHGGGDAITVETIDVHTHCSIDETKKIGFEIHELIPDLASTVQVHTAASRISRATWLRLTSSGSPLSTPITVIPGRCSMCSGSRRMSRAGDGFCCTTFSWVAMARRSEARVDRWRAGHLTEPSSSSSGGPFGKFDRSTLARLSFHPARRP